jgi:glycosyltransferase involved in cell wall biosynthesis
MAKSISVIIPALNEEKTIKQTIGSIPKEKLEQMGYALQVLIVDNNSKDRTGEFAREAGADVVFEPKRGYGQAYKAGFANARGDILVTGDADATYPLEDIPRLVGILDNEQLDFITTDRLTMLRNGSMSKRNKFGNFVLSQTMNMLFNIRIVDSQSGMWVFRRELLENMILKSNTPLSQEIKIEACHFLKSPWKEVAIQYRPRETKAKLGGWKVGMGNLAHLFQKRMVR